MNSLSNIRAAVSGVKDGSDEAYIAALEEATGGYWSATYDERREWINISLLPAVAIIALVTAGIGLIMLPLLFMTADSETTATLSINTDQGTIMRTGQAPDTGEKARLAALAKAIRAFIPEPETEAEPAEAEPYTDRPRF